MRRAPSPSRATLRRQRPLAAALVLAAAVSLAAAAPAAAAHPFYEEQLRRGATAFDRGDHAEAAEALRLASFGLLGEPPELAGCLARLALARRALGDVAGAREEVERVLDLEQRLGAYRAARLPEPLAASFAELAATTVPIERLSAMPAFEQLARGRLEDELEGLPPAARRRRLEELVAAEPEEPRWALQLGRMEMAERRFDRAVELAGRVLAAEPASQPAVCLRGRARAGAGDCAAATPDLAACEQSRSETAVAITRLDCLAELERWAEVRDLAAALPAALRADRQVARLERRAIKRAPGTVPAGEASAGTVPDGGAAPSPPPAMSPEDAARLQSAREQLAAARTTDDLAEAWSLARAIADRNPASTEAQHFAAEIAYRTSRWAESVDYFRRGGEPERPERKFYFAVALFESGEKEAAAEVLDRALPGLRRSPFVDGYTERILGAGNTP